MEWTGYVLSAHIEPIVLNEAKRMTSLYISTKNKDKLRELRELLGDEVEIHHPGDQDEDVEEIGSTLWENALLKAEEGFRRTGMLSIADDTGLEVDALNGEPGVYSSRYAGADATYQDNVDKMLRELNGVEAASRKARFSSVICCVREGDEPRRFDGVLEGTIIEQARGYNGFGYDPIFVPESDTRTLAELSAEEKNRISHRGRALRAFAQWWRTQV
ncbi:non-canonical purine NTP pyrophosphatase [bacterium BMS3Bbin04]|nr:non-canonical purine NTP pyrophosphatase [bacterium BMS3Bbin04]